MIAALSAPWVLRRKVMRLAVGLRVVTDEQLQAQVTAEGNEPAEGQVITDHPGGDCQEDDAGHPQGTEQHLLPSPGSAEEGTDNHKGGCKEGGRAEQGEHSQEAAGQKKQR